WRHPPTAAEPPPVQRGLPDRAGRSGALSVTREITARTWLVECYAPGLATATVTGDGERLRAAIEVVRPDAGPVDYLGALVVAGDEAVFYAFRAGDAASVEAVSRRAGLRFARIVESVGVA